MGTISLLHDVGPITESEAEAGLQHILLLYKKRLERPGRNQSKMASSRTKERPESAGASAPAATT
jgi:hypothetical protein